MKAYTVDYCMKSKYGIDCDTAIVFAENEIEVKTKLKDYIRTFNENYSIYVDNTCKIPIDNEYELGSIISVKEFSGSVFTRLFEDDGEI